MARVTNRLAALILALTTTMAATACSIGGDADDDKAGGGGPPVELRLADTNGELDFAPAVEYFVRRVEQLSGGDLRIEVVNEWGDYASDAEQQVVRGVAGGEVDLGWAGTRVFDTLGVKSFQALTAPMLVDSYRLENAVIESGITEQMMNELDELDVVGLGVLPDGLRKPIGVTAPILGPSDWRGITLRHAEVQPPSRSDPSTRGNAGAGLRDGARRRDRERDGPGLRGQHLDPPQQSRAGPYRSLRDLQRDLVAADGCPARQPGTSRSPDRRSSGSGSRRRPETRQPARPPSPTRTPRLSATPVR